MNRLRLEASDRKGKCREETGESEGVEGGGGGGDALITQDI